MTPPPTLWCERCAAQMPFAGFHRVTRRGSSDGAGIITRTGLAFGARIYRHMRQADGSTCNWHAVIVVR